MLVTAVHSNLSSDGSPTWTQATLRFGLHVELPWYLRKIILVNIHDIFMSNDCNELSTRLNANLLGLPEVGWATQLNPSTSQMLMCAYFHCLCILEAGATRML
jgi:hypothetical protein